jgi:flagellar protein FlaJ
MSTESETILKNRIPAKSGDPTEGGIASNLFRSYFRGKREKFNTLRDKLLKARIFVPVERWLSKAAFYAIIAALFAMVGYISLKFIILSLVSDFSLSIFDLALTMLLGGIAFLATFAGIYAYPGIMAWELKGKIDKNLPYAIGYISAMASVGMYPYAIFKKLSEAGETYCEVSDEMKLLVRDVELLGFDFITALKSLIDTTPSDHMRSFLQGAVTTALSGGDMGTYFINTAAEYMEERRKIYQEFIETLGLFAEFYVIGMVAAPLLLVVVMSIMVFLGGASLTGLAAIIYVVIPLGSSAFIVLIGTLSD